MGIRSRWKTQDGFILEWDSEKGEVEKYTSNGKKHLGGFDPVTGVQVSEAVKGRNIKKYL